MKHLKINSAPKNLRFDLLLALNITLLLFTTLAGVSTAFGQSVLFDFDNAPLQTSLPITLTVGGVTAHFSATGQGYSIQQANVLGFTPVGFSGL